MDNTPEQSCIFCSITAGDAPSDVVYSDDQMIAIKDVNPQAPVHVLLIPREHNLESLNEIRNWLAFYDKFWDDSLKRLGKFLES